MQKLQPRFSMLNAILVLTIFAMGVALWRTGHEVLPLRSQAKNYRKELGHFEIEDRTKVYAKRATGVYSKAWRWLLYLPSANFKVYVYEGNVPDLSQVGKQNWLNTVRSRASGFEGELIEGQFALDISVEEYDGNWYCRYGFLNEIKKTFSLKPADSWLSDLSKFRQFSDLGFNDATSFAADEPAVLLHVRRGEIVQAGNDWRVEEPAGPADSLVIWIERE